MSKVRLAAALFLVTSMGIASLTACGPTSASAVTVAAATTAAPKAQIAKPIKVQSMNVQMIFDGVNIAPPVGQYVFMYNNSTYVPLRFMSYALQKSVIWDAKNTKVTVAEPSSSELVVIKEYLMNATNGKVTPSAKNIVLNQVNASFDFNGDAKSLPAGQSSFILNGSLYVPLRFISEAVGHNISWDQKTKTITAASKAYQEQGGTDTSNSTDNNGKNTSPSATPAPTDTTGSAAGGGGGGAGSAKVSYESITSAAEAKLVALENLSTSTLMSIAFEYVGASDDTSRASIKAKGKQQLASFTADFDSIIADTQQKLNSNGYSTEVISQYKSRFASTLEKGRAVAEGMGRK